MSNEPLQSFENFLQINKNILDKGMAAYIKSNSLADLSRIFNELPDYSGINQPIRDNFRLALEFDRLDFWYQLMMAYTVKQLFNPQGELTLSIKNIFVTAGIDIKVLADNEFKKALVSSFFTNILGPITGGLAKERLQFMEQKGLLALDDPTDDPIYKDQKAFNKAVLALDKIDKNFIQNVTREAVSAQIKIAELTPVKKQFAGPSANKVQNEKEGISENLYISRGMFGKGFFGRLKSYVKAHPIKSLLIGAAVVVGIGAFIVGSVFSGGALAAATGIAATFGAAGLGGIGVVGGVVLTGVSIGILGDQTKKHALLASPKNDLSKIFSQENSTQKTIDTQKNAKENFSDLLQQLYLNDNKKIVYQNNQLKVMSTNFLSFGKQGMSKETTDAFSKSLNVIAEINTNDLFSARDHLHLLRSTHWAKVVLPNNPQLYEHFIEIETKQIKQIAQELFVINRADFLNIPDEELLDPSSYNKTEKSPNLTKNAKHFNQISSVAITDILKSTDLFACTQRVAFWINVAAECREQGNFAGMQAIMAGLGHSSISRLLQHPTDNSPSVVMRGLPRTLQNKFYQLQTLISSVGAYKNLRHAIQEQQGSIIPYLGIYQTDLTFAKEGEPDETKSLTETIGGKKTLTVIQAARTSLNNNSVINEVNNLVLDKAQVMDNTFDEAQVNLSRQVAGRDELKTKKASLVLMDFSLIGRKNKIEENLFKMEFATPPAINPATAETLYQGRYQILVSSKYKENIVKKDIFYQQHKTILDDIKNSDLTTEEKLDQVSPIYIDLHQQREELDKTIAVVTTQRQLIDKSKGDLKKQIELLTLHLADARPMLQEILHFYTDAKSKALVASQGLIEEGDKSVLYLEGFLEKFNKKFGENAPLYLSDLTEKNFNSFYPAIDNLRKLINAVANVDDQVKNEHNAIVTGQYMPVINAYFSKQQTQEIFSAELQAKINKKEKNLVELLSELDNRKFSLKDIEANSLIERTYSDFMADMSVQLQAAERLLDNELVNGISLDRLAKRIEYDPKLIAGLDWEQFADHHNLLAPEAPIDLDQLIFLNQDRVIKVQLKPELMVQLRAMNQQLNLSITDTMIINQAFDQLKDSKIATDNFINLFKEKTHLENLSRAFIASLPVSIVSNVSSNNKNPVVSEVIFSKVKSILTETIAPILESSTISLVDLAKQASHVNAKGDSDVQDELNLPIIEVLSDNNTTKELKSVSPELLKIQEKLLVIDTQQAILNSQKNSALQMSQNSLQALNQSKNSITLDSFLDICKTLQNYKTDLQNPPAALANLEALLKNTTKYFFKKLATEIKLLEPEPNDHLDIEKLNICIKMLEKLKGVINSLPENLSSQSDLQMLNKMNLQLTSLINKEKLLLKPELHVATNTFKSTTPQSLSIIQLSGNALTYNRTDDGRYSNYQRPPNYVLDSSKDKSRGYTNDEKNIIKDMVDNSLKTGETQFNFNGDKELCRKAAHSLLVVLPAAAIYINNADKPYQPDLKERMEINSKRQAFKVAEESNQLSEPTSPRIGSAA